MRATTTETGNSDWIELKEMGLYRIDVDIPSAVTTAVKIHTQGTGANEPKTMKLPEDSSTDLSEAASFAFMMYGPCKIRHSETRSSGSGTVATSAAQVEAGI